jgi:hypothetical protein
VQQVDAGDAGAGADLDDRLGVGRGGEQSQGRAGAGGDDAQPGFTGTAAGPYQRVALGDEGVRERPARLPVAGNRPLPVPVPERRARAARVCPRWRLYPLRSGTR